MPYQFRKHLDNRGIDLVFKNGAVRVERYWNLNYEPKISLTEDDLLDELEQRMLETIRYHMVSDVPVGAFLSGGLDSSLVVAMMSRVSSQPIKTLSGMPGIDRSLWQEITWDKSPCFTCTREID